jgi:hypothetical protein
LTSNNDGKEKNISRYSVGIPKGQKLLGRHMCRSDKDIQKNHEEILWSSVRVPDYRSRGPGSIPGAIRFS